EQVKHHFNSTAASHKTFINIIIYADVVTILPHSQAGYQLSCQRVSRFFKTYKVATPNLSVTVIII
ncbi:hypothetical protein F8W87_22280, partial [Salmonella enterica]|nr:hypothetical protein [Salmonella enterica]